MNNKNLATLRISFALPGGGNSHTVKYVSATSRPGCAAMSLRTAARGSPANLRTRDGAENRRRAYACRMVPSQPGGFRQPPRNPFVRAVR
jgi:hypothetical protein